MAVGRGIACRNGACATITLGSRGNGSVGISRGRVCIVFAT